MESIPNIFVHLKYNFSRHGMPEYLWLVSIYGRERMSKVGKGTRSALMCIDQETKIRSVDPFSWTSGVDLLEGKTCTGIQDCLWLEALVLIVTVGNHAGLESLEVNLAELLEDILTRRVFVFSCETRQHTNEAELITGRSEKKGMTIAGYLLDDSLIDEGRLLTGTTKHVAHILHWHVD